DCGEGEQQHSQRGDDYQQRDRGYGNDGSDPWKQHRDGNNYGANSSGSVGSQDRLARSGGGESEPDLHNQLRQQRPVGCTDGDGDRSDAAEYDVRVGNGNYW